MNRTTRIRVNGLLAAGLLIAATSCAQGSLESSLSAPAMSIPSSAGGWLSEDHRSIGLVALGPDQFLYHDWFEFEPAYKDYFAQAPTYTTHRSKILKHRNVELGDAFDEAITAHFGALGNGSFGSGEGAALGLVLAPMLITVGALSRTAIGRFEWVRPPRVSQPLDTIDGLGESNFTELLDKQGLAQAICGQIIERGNERSGRIFFEVPFEQARERSQVTARADALLTARVQSIDLIADDGDDPKVRLFIHVWVNFGRAASFPIEYTGGKLALSTFTAGGALRLKEEIDRGVEEIAARIVDVLLPAAASG